TGVQTCALPISELRFRDATHVVGGGLPRELALVDVRGTDEEGQAKPLQDLRAARGARPEHEGTFDADHGARIPQARPGRCVAGRPLIGRRDMRLRHLLPLLCLWGAPATAAAQTDCSGPLSPCENAQGFDLALAPGRFATLEDARTQLDPGKLSVGLAGSYARRPLSLSAASPDPEGRSVPLVRDVWQMDLLVAVGLPHRLQLALGLPLRVAQDGAGIEAVTSRQGGQLRPMAVVDPRVALGWQLFDRVLDGAVSGRARLELALPLGDELVFAGAPGPTWAPA